MNEREEMQLKSLILKWCIKEVDEGTEGWYSFNMDGLDLLVDAISKYYKEKKCGTK